MLTIWAKLITDSKTIKSDTFTSQKSDMAEALLECIEYFSKEFDIEAPMWHTNHTKQLGIFHKATFKQDDFIDRFDYDKFEIQILED